MTRLALGLSALLLLAAPTAFADAVYLTNGSAFEDVVATVRGEQVVIRLSYGEIVLPMTSVERLEVGRSALEEYLGRRDDLRARGGRAEEWVELSRWARARGLDHAFGEAARTAASLDPAAPGLAPLMTALEQVWDGELGRWLPYDEHMRRSGMVLADGEWITRPEAEERAEQRRQREAAEAERRRAERSDRTLALAEALIAKELAEVPAPPSVVVPWVSYALPAPVVYPVPVSRVVARAGSSFSATSNQAFPDLVSRQPGSLLPIRSEPAPSNRGSMAPPAGGDGR